ncbi:hypothetical protein V5O48_018701 [Marasmius crinis-equi]|uniref:Uncharacterized protein n=1 Tax=Marasmius crinis-equi TaxID=585013 RepID=A0ABR3EKG1_9AGAR
MKQEACSEIKQGDLKFKEMESQGVCLQLVSAERKIMRNIEMQERYIAQAEAENSSLREEYYKLSNRCRDLKRRINIRRFNQRRSMKARRSIVPPRARRNYRWLKEQMRRALRERTEKREAMCSSLLQASLARHMITSLQKELAHLRELDMKLLSVDQQ